MAESTYKPSGEIYGVDFSDVPGKIFPAYVPQFKPPGFSQPLVMCDISGFSTRFIGWQDPADENSDYLEHNLFHDVSAFPPAQDGAGPIFSVMKQWTPPANESLEDALEN